MDWIKLNLIVGIFGIFLAVPASAETIQVFLQGGQSNCVGNASDTGLPVELQLPQTDIPFYFGESPTQGGIDLVDYDLLWIDLQPGSGYDFGPEILFGRTMADAVANQIAIIKYGHGGTGFVTSDSNRWDAGGDATTTGDGNVYQAFQATVTAGLASLASANPGAAIEIAGMIWIQGEKDAQDEPGDYETDLTAFFEDIRLTYGADLPIVLAQLSDNQTALNVTNLNIVKTAQANIAAADPRIEMVVTDTYGVNGDNIHFDPSAQIALGTEMATGMMDLLSVPYCANPPVGDISGPDQLQDCKVDFYDFAVLAADWLDSGIVTGPTSPGELEINTVEPLAADVINSQTNAPGLTRIFSLPDGTGGNDNHGRGGVFTTPDNAGDQWSMASITLVKNAAQTFANGTVSLWVFEGTAAQWNAGDGDSDGDLFDGTGITNVLVDGETFTINGAVADESFLHFNLASAVLLDENTSYGFIFLYEDNEGPDYLEIHEALGTAGTQLRILTGDNTIITNRPVTYYVTGTNCVSSKADISGPAAGQPDCTVDIYDLAALATGWLDCGIEPVEECGQ